MFCTEIYFQSLQFVLTRLHNGDNSNDEDDEKIAPRILAPLTVSIWNNVYIMDVIHAEHPQANYQEELTNAFVTSIQDAQLWVNEAGFEALS